MAAEIPALNVSRDSAVVSSPGSWFHSLILDGKKDSLYVLVLQYGMECIKDNYYARFQPSSCYCCREMHLISRLDVKFLDWT